MMVLVRPWKRRLSDDERSVLLSELLLRHLELVAEAEEITSTLLVVENDQELADEITARLRALGHSGPVAARAGSGVDGRVPVGGTVLSRYAVGRGFQEAQVEQVHEAQTGQGAER
jgi:hypothetical protein